VSGTPAASSSVSVAINHHAAAQGVQPALKLKTEKQTQARRLTDSFRHAT